MKKKLKTLFFYSFLTVVLGLLIAVPSTAQQNLVDLSSKANDYFFDISQGNVKNTGYINKFGRTTNADQDVPTDIWDGANSNDDLPTWPQPSYSQYHLISSSSTNDTGGGGGARTLYVEGVNEWNGSFVSENITLNGLTNVTTANKYVIIYRMTVLTSGNDINSGVIKAYTQNETTVTAQINTGKGQTEMAIWGCPSGTTVYIKSFYSSVLKQGGGSGNVFADFSGLVNSDPENSKAFSVKRSWGLNTGGSSVYEQEHQVLPKFPCPAILKMRVRSSANNADVSGGFDIITKS